MTPAEEKDYLTDILDLPNFGYTLASPGERFGAVIVEDIVIYVPLYFVLGNSNLIFNDNLFDISSLALQAGIAAVLGAIFYSAWSGNLGHKLFGMKVISSVDGSDQKSFITGALREGLKSVFGLFFIPTIWLLWDSKKQNLYDKIVKTLVVKRL